MSSVLYLIGFSQLGKLLFGVWVIWTGVWVVLLCQLEVKQIVGRKMRAENEEASDLNPFS